MTSNQQPAAAGGTSAAASDEEWSRALRAYVAKVKEHRECEAKVKKLREEVKKLAVRFEKTEDDLKALQGVGQLIGEVLRQLDSEKFIVKTSSGPRYMVGSKPKIDKASLTAGTRVALDMTTLTVMRRLQREVDPLVFNMLHEDPGSVQYGEVGGLSEQVRQLREVVELPLTNPELFKRVGIKTPKGVLLYGPPGTGKTLLARAMASNMSCNFMKVVASAIVDKYIGESARVIREMFEVAVCVRNGLQLLNQLDGFDELGAVKIIMATNRPDVLDPALMRPGRLDRKIEIPLPNETARVDILKIHSRKIAKQGDVDYEAVCKLCDGFNGADLRSVCTEAGMFAIRAERDYVTEEDFFKAARKLAENKKLESTIDYEKV
ncbi:UNVERIFIED_CONTAM: hypothetical protein H355_016348 [Colinus virginianus]|nr:hypothetical protein H355_016348 [Colinus virginianus]